MLELFDVKNTVTKPFDAINRSFPNPDITTVGDYGANNYPCGTVNVSALTDLTNSIKGKISDALDSLVELGCMVDNAIEKGMEMVAAAMDVIALIDELINTDYEELANEVIDAVMDGINTVIDTAKAIVDSFISAVTSPFSFNGTDVPGENPITSLANAFKCDAASLLGLASAALAAVGMDPSMLDSAADSITGLMGDGTGFVSDSIKSAEDLINSSPISRAVFNLGYPILIATAMGSMNLSGRQKTAAACYLAQSLNRFKNFDPLIQALTGSTIVENLLGTVWNVNTEVNSTCSCCFAKGKYNREELNINFNFQNSHTTNAFLDNIDTLTGIFTDWGNKNSSKVSNDNVSRLITNAKLKEDNLLTRSLLMGLEGMRLGHKAKSNLEEVKLDRSKKIDFASEVSLDMLYLKNFSSETVSRNSFYNESITNKIRETK